MHPRIQLGLFQAKPTRSGQHHIRQVVHQILAVFPDPPYRNGPSGIHAAPVLFVCLQPEAIHQFLGIFPRKGAAIQIRFQIGIQIHIQPAEGKSRYPRLDFQQCVREPDKLQRLMEIPGRFRGNMVAHIGKVFQFRLAVSPFACFQKPPGFICIAPDIALRTLSAQERSLQKIPFGRNLSLPIGKRGLSRCNLSLNAPESNAEREFILCNDMA